MGKILRVVDNEPVDETERYFLDMIARFRKVFTDLPIEAYLNPSSESLSYTVSVVGYHLDNAQGDYISIDGVIKGFQEIVLVVESFYDARPAKKKFVVEQFNLATMIAVLRQYGPADEYTSRNDFDNYRNADRAHKALDALKIVTKECGRDMHEPDNALVEGHVMANYKNKSDDTPRPAPMVRIERNGGLGVDLYVDDLLYLMGNIRRV